MSYLKSFSVKAELDVDVDSEDYKRIDHLYQTGQTDRLLTGHNFSGQCEVVGRYLYTKNGTTRASYEVRGA